MADGHRERLKGLNSKLRLSKQDEVETTGEDSPPCAGSKSVDRNVVPEGNFYQLFSGCFPLMHIRFVSVFSVNTHVILDQQFLMWDTWVYSYNILALWNFSDVNSPISDFMCKVGLLFFL